ncbi:hypothetical protein [Micromonospora sp. NPDC048947]|uniref:hypothetical protein n=1 Tax=Micromonospora sp. NPDC048947 TaxID=3154826 RepID=UPI0033F054C5
MEHEDDGGVEATGRKSGHDVYQGNELLHIASTNPTADVEAVRRRVAEMGNFRELATDALNVLERQHQSTLAANSQSQEWFHRACQDTREIFRDVMAGDLEWEQQRYVIDQLMKLLQMEGEKDTENKSLLSTLSDKLSTKMVLVGGVAAAATAVAVAVVAPKAARQIGEALRKV